jgi:hypothetical protein
VLAGIIVVGAVLGIERFSTVRGVAIATGAAGLLLVHRRLRGEFPLGTATLATLLLFGATSLFWSVTHAASFRDTALFAAIAAFALGATRGRTARAEAGAWTAVAVGAIALRAASGSAAVQDDGLQLTTVGDALFLPAGGFFALTPLAYVAAVGMVLYARRFPARSLASLAVFVAWVLSLRVWPASVGEPFGHGLTPTLALLAPGLAYVIDVTRRRPLLAVMPLLAAAVAWNYWLMVQYTIGTLPKDAPVSFSSMVRQQADVHTRPPFLYPFALPANAWFAWREGVPVDRYELLSREPIAPSLDLVFDRGADRFLLDGWGGAGSTPAGPARWTAARRSQLVVPVRPSATGMTITLSAAARADDPPVLVQLALLVNGGEIGRFTVPPELSEARFPVPATSVGRVLRAGYNRVTIVQHGIQRVDPNDTRAFGPLASRAGTAPFPVAIQRLQITPAP